MRCGFLECLSLKAVAVVERTWIFVLFGNFINEKFRTYTEAGKQTPITQILQFSKFCHTCFINHPFSCQNILKQIPDVVILSLHISISISQKIFFLTLPQ